MGFDGQNFEAVDQEGYQNDSLIAGDAQPLDVALHRRIASNARAMELDFDRCGQHLLLDAADISTATDPDGRAFVSVRGGVFLVVPLEFERPPASVTVDIGADIRGHLLTEADARLTATLKTIGGPEYSATLDVDGATGYDTYRLTIDDLGGASARNALLLLGCQSTSIEEVIITTSGVTSPDDRTVTLSGTDYAMTPAATSGQPSPSSGTQQDVYVTSRAQDSVFLGGSTAFEDISHMYAPGSDAPSVDDYMITHNDASVANDGGDFSIRAASFVQVRHVGVSISYRDGVQPNESLRANIVERTSVTRKHATVQDEQYSRPRLAMMAQNIKREQASGWPESYRSQWRYADTGAATSLASGSIGPLRDLSTVSVNLALMPMDLRGVGSSGFVEAFAEEAIRQRTSAADWDITLSAFQYADGSGSLALVKEASVAIESVDHYLPTKESEFPFLWQAYTQKATDSANGYGFTYREGQLVAGDLDLLQVQRFTVDISDETFDDELPIVFNIGAEYVANSYQPFGIGDEGDLRLICVGVSVYLGRSF